MSTANLTRSAFRFHTRAYSPRAYRQRRHRRPLCGCPRCPWYFPLLGYYSVAVAAILVVVIVSL